MRPLAEALDKLRKLNNGLATWIHDNKLERWVQSKFKKERWRKLNDNLVKSYNK